MPNWVHCACEVTGDPAEVKRFHDTVFRTVPFDQAFGSLKTEGMDTVFDFGAVIPPQAGTVGHPGVGTRELVGSRVEQDDPAERPSWPHSGSSRAQ